MRVKVPRVLVSLAVATLATIGTGAAAQATPQDAALQGTTWMLIEIAGKPVKTADPRRAPSITLHEATPTRFSGMGGCNRIMGTYDLQASSLTLGSATATRMMCPDAMDVEAAFIDALTKVRTWSVRATTLDLQDTARQTVARFEATPPAASGGAGSARFVNRVWRVERSDAVAAGTLYVFLSDGTLIVASQKNKPMVGRWQFTAGTLTLVEEGLPYRVDILESAPDTLRLRSHNPGGAVELTLVPAPASAP